MPEEVIHITEEGFNDFAKDAPDAAIVMLYSLSKYFEKYKVTEWCLKLLIKKGYEKEDMKKFSKDFTDFFHQMLSQEDL